MVQRTGLGAIAVSVIIIMVVAAYLATRPAAPPKEEETPTSPTELTFNQTTIGSRIISLYYTGHGPWWGPNIVKIVSTENKIFTYVMDCSTAPWQTFLYSKVDGGEWQEGESFNNTGNPPNLMIDSQGYIHLISFDRCLSDNFDDSWYGRIFHVKFDQPNTVNGSCTFEYITPDSRETDYGLDDVANPYVGAAIGEDDTILVAYPTVVGDTYGIGVRIYDPISDEWSYEAVTTSLPTNFTYPFAAVTGEYFHVLTIQDCPNENFPVGGPYRLGIVKHFQRARNSGEWVESTLVDFTAVIDANPQVSDLLWLSNMDLFVDSGGAVHVMIRYNRNWSQGWSGNWINTAFHYWKMESAVEWQSEQVLDEQCYWLKLWEREDGQLFYIYSNRNEQLYLMPQGTTERYVISSLDSPYNIDPIPFIATTRSGTQPSSVLNLVIFSGTEETEGISISCDVSSL